MKTGESQRGRRWIRLWSALVLVVAALQGCALYQSFLEHGGALPLGGGGAAWSPAVSTPAGAAVGVQFIQRF